MDRQEKLRLLVKRAKWEKGFSYKQIATDLQMNYRAFMNFVNGRCKLGYEREIILKAYLYAIL